jgi:hypothetical protein
VLHICAEIRSADLAPVGSSGSSKINPGIQASDSEIVVCTLKYIPIPVKIKYKLIQVNALAHKKDRIQPLINTIISTIIVIDQRQRHRPGSSAHLRASAHKGAAAAL